MSVKESLLSALESCRGEYRSGAALAKALGVSRNAVWKAAASLRAEGHAVESSRREGYRLLPQSNVLSVQSVAPHLRHPALLPEVFAEVGSTNALLRERAEAGAPEGTLLLAGAQTEGRGRRGRSFHSPPGGGIYMSLLLRPKLLPEEALLLTTCAAVAVCEATEALTGVAPQIKWVNDLYCRGRKVCGIATEATVDLEGGGLRYAVLGIGLNLYPPPGGFPPELSEVAGSVLDGAPSGELRSRLAAEIANRFWEEYPHLRARRFLEAYRRASFLPGQTVRILREGAEAQEAEALFVDGDVRLVVRHRDGRVEPLSSGEVSVREGGGPTDAGATERPKFG